MSSATVRLSEATRVILRELAAQRREPMSVVLQDAVECYRRQYLLEQASAAYAALRHDPEAWQEELAERRQWDIGLGDGLDDDEGRA